MKERPLGDVIDEAIATDPSARFDLLDELRDHPELGGATDSVAYRAALLLSRSGDPSDLPSVAELSLKAHGDGVADAGPIHAEASDKIALYSGRPQLYGTVMIEQNGEIVQPPVDKRIADHERIALGVPTLAELRSRMHTVARDLAAERATQPGVLPPNQRFCRVWLDLEPAVIRRRMALTPAVAAMSSPTDAGSGASFAVWAEGDVVTFAVEATDAVTVPPAFPIETWDGGDGLQILSVRVDRLDEAVITYSFNPVGAPLGFGTGRGSHDGRFRGVNAPEELPSNGVLIGDLAEYAVDSPSLGEARSVSVYTPPGHSPGTVPVLYATDGNMLAPYARRLDAMIQAQRCPPVVVVAAHAARFDPLLGNRRAAEYLPGFDLGLHRAHRTFFVEELSSWAEGELGVPAEGSRRGVWGCSDGAGHAALLAVERPDLYAHAFVFSTGMPPDLTHPWDDDHPAMHLCAGTLEGGFHHATQAWAGYLTMSGADHHFTERVAAHDLIQWAEELPRALARAWG